MDKYRPISCAWYDELEARATLKKICTLRYRSSNDRIVTVSSRLFDFKTREHEEFVLIKDDRWIRLDHLIQVDELILKDVSNC